MTAYFFGTVTVLLVALLIEDALGYPDGLFRRIGHPVTWIGALISWLDRQWNRESLNIVARKLFGVLAVVILAGLPVLLTLLLQMMLQQFVPPWLSLGLQGLLGASLIAQKSLRDHVRQVISGLDQGIEAGRKAVAMIVGRDTSTLDEAGVSRAAVESLAENSSDGIVAPALWCLVFGLPGLVFYKAVNTADSMIGHKSERHLAFGWAAARLDDLVNLPASRFTALLFAISAPFSRASTSAAFRAALRDAAKHQSPNAGWPEAAMAGSLGFSLGGPRSYGGEIIDLPTMGQGRAALTRSDIARALELQTNAMRIMTLAIFALFVTLALM